MRFSWLCGASAVKRVPAENTDDDRGRQQARKEARR
jgi:hypothetical protein